MVEGGGGKAEKILVPHVVHASGKLATQFDSISIHDTAECNHGKLGEVLGSCILYCKEKNTGNSIEAKM